MPTLNATVGAAAANSYATADQATVYFDERLNSSAWTDADPEDQVRALIQATRMIDREEFEGSSVHPLNGAEAGSVATQALKWPRYSADDDSGWRFAFGSIPPIVLQATYECALWLLIQGSTDPLQPTGLEGFETVKVGPLETTPRQGFEPGALPTHVRRLLDPVLRRGKYSARIRRS